MAIVKKPDPLPSPLDYVPPNSAAYPVQAGDSWYTLAERPEVRKAGMTANDLCQFNFKTRKPAEINWYLYHKVGTRKTTKDGKNYVFSNADSPGVVYLPKVGPPPPVTEATAGNPSDRLNMWFGLGGKGGAQVVVVGNETVAGWVFSLDDPSTGMAVTANVHRLGPGVGASGGVCLIFVTGVRGPADLNGHLQGDWDFNLSLGPKWGSVASAGVKLKKLKPLVDIVAKLGAKSPAALKAALKAHPDKYVELMKAGRSLKDSLGLDPHGEPNVLVVDVPFAGVGTEASVFFGVAEFNALWDNTGD